MYTIKYLVSTELPLVRCLGSHSSTFGKLSGEVYIPQFKSNVHF